MDFFDYSKLLLLIKQLKEMIKGDNYNKVNLISSTIKIVIKHKDWDQISVCFLFHLRFHLITLHLCYRCFL